LFPAFDAMRHELTTAVNTVKGRLTTFMQGHDFISYFPDVVWYLTGDGSNMWARRPYGFLFTTSDAATAFAKVSGTSLELTPIGVQRGDLLSPDGLDGIRRLGVTRLFIDPSIDAASGDVVGKILRLEAAGGGGEIASG
jgi:hypothetical protein